MRTPPYNHCRYCVNRKKGYSAPPNFIAVELHYPATICVLANNTYEVSVKSTIDFKGLA
jgi:hypothetical protein